MPTYKCPKCGKTVELPPGEYYCKECSTLFKKVWMEEVRPPPPPPPPPPPVIQTLINQGLLLRETESEDSVHWFLVNEPRREWELGVDYEDKKFHFSIGDYWGSFFKESYDIIRTIVETLEKAGYRYSTAKEW
jgi:hypothetical protein